MAPPSEHAVPAAAAASRPGGQVHCVGLVTMDIIFSTGALPQGPGKCFAHGLAEVGGGPASSAAVCVARLGGAASIAGRLGDDDTGRRLAEELQREGVDTAWLRRLPGVRSPLSAVMVDTQGERSVMAFSDPQMPPEADWLRPVLQGGTVLADLSWPQGARRLFDLARAAGLPTVLDADRFRHPASVVEDLLRSATHVIFSRPGLAQLTGQTDIAAGLRAAEPLGASAAVTAVTDGEHGVHWWADGALRRQRPPAVSAVDTTGAGDAFHGAYALALARGAGPDECMRFATAVAAAKCVQPGGRAGLPDAAALAAFLHRHPLPDIE